MRMALEAAGTGLQLSLMLFASTYVVMTIISTGSFSQPMNPIARHDAANESADLCRRSSCSALHQLTST